MIVTKEQISANRIPVFKNYEEEAAFWDTHDVSEYWEELSPATVRFAKDIMRGNMKGVKVMNQRTPSSAQNLLQLAGIIPKESKLPTDFATHHDKYAWE